MRIFLTGATGYIGGALAGALRDRGHDVSALVRPDSDASRLREQGVAIVAGDLGTLPELTGALAETDVLVHTASARGKDAIALDATAVDVFRKQQAFFVFTSGVWVLGDRGDRKVSEATPVEPIAMVAWRPAHEQTALAAGRGAVVRPGCVYGGKQSLLAEWFAAASQRRPLQVVGEGTNHWAMVDLHDLADCYVRVIEQRAAGVFHAVDDTRATINDCARAVAPAGTIEHVPAGVARQTMGPFADALMIDQNVSSETTRRRLGWAPRRTFLSSIDAQWREWRAGAPAQRGAV